MSSCEFPTEPKGQVNRHDSQSTESHGPRMRVAEVPVFRSGASYKVDRAGGRPSHLVLFQRKPPPAIPAKPSTLYSMHAVRGFWNLLDEALSHMAHGVPWVLSKSRPAHALQLRAAGPRCLSTDARLSACMYICTYIQLIQRPISSTSHRQLKQTESYCRVHRGRRADCFTPSLNSSPE